MRTLVVVSTAVAMVAGSAEGLLQAGNNGVNLQPSYYNDGNVTFGWPLMAQHEEIRTLRIEIEPDKVEVAQMWLAEAVAAGFGSNIVVTYHKYEVLGSDDVSDLTDAAQWWVDNYDTLSAACGHCGFTVNLMNEWGSHAQTVESFSSAYNTALATIRTVYATGDVVVDIPGWGQETSVAAGASPLLVDQHVVLSAHVYEGGWNAAANRYLVPSDMDELAATGRPCLVGEFGFDSGVVNNPDSHVNVAAVVQRAKEVGFVAVLAWAWNGDGGVVMNMVQPAWWKSPNSTRYHESEYFGEVIGLLL